MMSSIITAMKGCCQGCGQSVELVKHHWYDDETRLSGHWVYICQACNMKLRTPTDSPNHVLPSWGIQRIAIRERKTLEQCLIYIQEMQYAETRIMQLNEELGRAKARCEFLEEQVKGLTTSGDAILLKSPKVTPYVRAGIPSLLRKLLGAE